MSPSPISPPVFKGAIVAVDAVNPLASVVVFQYNPESLSRTLQARTAGGEGLGPVRLAGPPEETIKIGFVVDAADQLQQGDPTAGAMGVYPALSALEMLLYPRAAVAIANEALARVGVIEVIPMEAPLTLLIWGPRRIVPVRVTEFSVAEEAFDLQLNPIRAKVDLGLKVLTYDDLGMLSPGGALYLAHQVAKEVMATMGGAGALSAPLSAAL
jgi:hypothetical protein